MTDYIHFYEGPPLKNLEILEFTSISWGVLDAYVGYRFIDFCPSLKSAHLYNVTEDETINPFNKNYSMRDLVIEFSVSDNLIFAS